MTIRRKSILILVGSVFFLTIIMVLVTFRILVQGFQTIENQRVERLVTGLEYAVSDQEKQIGEKIADWAIWDDTYKFMVDRNKAYIVSNLTVESFEKNGVDEALFVGKSGELVTAFLTKTDSGGSEFPGDIYSHFATGSAILRDEKGSGLLNMGNRIVIFSYHSVLRSDGSGPSVGTMVFARYFDQKVLDTMSNLSGFKVSMVLGNKLDRFDGGKKTTLKINGQNMISGFLVLEDVFGEPIATLRVDVDREIHLKGLQTMRDQGISVAVLGLVVGIVNYKLLNATILKKVANLVSEVNDVTKTGDVKLRIVTSDEHDEISSLRLSINHMMARLQRFQLALDSANTHAIITDTEGVIVYANPAVEKNTGFLISEIVGKTPALWGKQMPKEFYESLWTKIKRDKQVFKGEIINKRKNGELYTAFATISPIINQMGILEGFVGLEDDITEVKSKNDELKRMNDLMVGRELKMAELKKEISKLQKG